MLLIIILMCFCDIIYGQLNLKKQVEPWNYDDNLMEKIKNDNNIPPDLRFTRKKLQPEASSVGLGEWFFKRTLGIVLRGGQIKENEDHTVDVSLQMKFDEQKWQLLNNYIKLNTPMSEDMFRRSIGYVEEAIYKPTIIEEIVMAWHEYIEYHLIEYKFHITCGFGIIAAVTGILWLWRFVSQKNIKIILFIALYLYEVLVSYKEMEKQEVNTFLAALDKCKWYFWKSSCELPAPDLLTFLKYMNPIKIAIRMFTTLISEPIVSISDIMKTLIYGITDGLWYPLDKIVYGMLILIFNVLLIFLLIMIIFNFILNIPFNLSLLGLLNIGIRQRERTIFSEHNVNQSNSEKNDRISGATLDKLLEVCSRALNNSQNTQNLPAMRIPRITATTSTGAIKRSASTGRLSDYQDSRPREIETSIRKRPNVPKRYNGGGDAF